MAARALSTGTVSFGLVSIPIKVYSATESGSAISFNLLHKDCGSRLRQQYVCIKDEKIVPRDEMVKGYEFAKDQYVVMTPEELKELEEKSTQSIDITEFVPLTEVDPIYFDKAYYLGPDKGGDKAYRLLASAMKASGRCALARYAARGKMYLVMIRPTIDDRLVMQQLHYQDEVRLAKEIPIPDGVVKEPELQLALQIIEQGSKQTFDPSGYEDETKKRIEDVLQKKIEGQEISVAPVEEPKAQIIDLMEALRQSLSQKAVSAPQPKAVPAPEATAAVAAAASGGESTSASGKTKKPRAPKKAT